MCWEWQHFYQRRVIKWTHQDVELGNDPPSLGGDWGMVGGNFLLNIWCFFCILCYIKNFYVFKNDLIKRKEIK